MCSISVNRRGDSGFVLFVCFFLVSFLSLGVVFFWGGGGGGGGGGSCFCFCFYLFVWFSVCYFSCMSPVLRGYLDLEVLSTQESLHH